MMGSTFGLFTQVSDSGPHDSLFFDKDKLLMEKIARRESKKKKKMYPFKNAKIEVILSMYLEMFRYTPISEH